MKKQNVALKPVICLSSCIMSNLDIYTQELVVECMSNYLTSSFKLGCGVSVVAKLVITCRYHQTMIIHVIQFTTIVMNQPK